MKTIKVSELTGAALDWAVARCEDYHSISIDTDIDGTKRINYGGMYPEWSSDWEHGGPIIERELINVIYMQGSQHWMSTLFQPTLDTTPRSAGPTPLIAAMRCYVASKLGDTVEVPKELAT